MQASSVICARFSLLVFRYQQNEVRWDREIPMPRMSSGTTFSVQKHTAASHANGKFCMF